MKIKKFVPILFLMCFLLFSSQSASSLDTISKETTFTDILSNYEKEGYLIENVWSWKYNIYYTGWLSDGFEWEYTPLWTTMNMPKYNVSLFTFYSTKNGIQNQDIVKNMEEIDNILNLEKNTKLKYTYHSLKNGVFYVYTLDDNYKFSGVKFKKKLMYIDLTIVVKGVGFHISWPFSDEMEKMLKFFISSISDLKEKNQAFQKYDSLLKDWDIVLAQGIVSGFKKDKSVWVSISEVTNTEMEKWMNEIMASISWDKLMTWSLNLKGEKLPYTLNITHRIYSFHFKDVLIKVYKEKIDSLDLSSYEAAIDDMIKISQSDIKESHYTTSYTIDSYQ